VGKAKAREAFVRGVSGRDPIAAAQGSGESSSPKWGPAMLQETFSGVAPLRAHRPRSWYCYGIIAFMYRAVSFSRPMSEQIISGYLPSPKAPPIYWKFTSVQAPALSILQAGSFPKDGSEPLEKKDQIFQELTARAGRLRALYIDVV
jgi:hypothetical protein